MMPPLPPPSGMSTRAHFQVIQAASARTVSMVSSGWKRMPPLVGPRASLYCTRNPWKVRIEPSSMRTGRETWSSRIGSLRAAATSGSSLRILAHSSNCCCAISNGLISAIFSSVSISGISALWMLYFICKYPTFP